MPNNISKKAKKKNYNNMPKKSKSSGSTAKGFLPLSRPAQPTKGLPKPQMAIKRGMKR